MNNFALVFILICYYHSHELHYSTQEIKEAINQQKVTYNSALRIRHVRTGYNLHSEEIRYTQDNEKFPVTVGSKNDEFNTLWIVSAGNTEV